MIDKTNKTFVYEGKEWNLTGRTAKKAIFHKRIPNKQTGVMTIIEISPRGIGSNDSSFFKWVDPRELFYINEVDEINVDKLRKDNDEADHEKD